MEIKMALKKDDRTVSKVTIEYSDGNKVDLETYGLVGFSDNTWYSVLFSPAEAAAKITLNNMLVEITETIIHSIHDEVHKPI